MTDFGTALRRAREAAGLTLDDLFERTRINLRHLRAIEAGDFPSVPQTYIRAFIREYARTVGLDEMDTLQAYNEMAEAQAGIPRPPDAIDNSNIIPQRDDSIEIVSTSDATPVHVEVVGSVEVEDFEPFVPPVRKSPSVTGDQETIDIRTVAPRSEPPTPPLPVVPPPSASMQKKQKKEKRKDRKDAASSAATPPSAATPASAAAGMRADVSAPAPRDESAPVPPAGDVRAFMSASTPGTLPTDAAVPPVITVDDAAHRGTVDSPAPPASPIPPKREPPRSTPERRPAAVDEEAEQRRILLIGSVVVLIVVLAVFALFHFSGGEESTGGMLDSTAIRASIDAGKFIDSSQNVFVEPEPPLPDTTTVQPAEEKAMEPAPQVFARDDSLVLEAFSNAPVWFSVRMDTTRTERGQLSTNDHRVWKARDRFMITLGDAGAVTFFLNGREVGTLGEEGAVVKNVTLTRQNARGEQ